MAESEMKCFPKSSRPNGLPHSWTPGPGAGRSQTVPVWQRRIDGNKPNCRYHLQAEVGFFLFFLFFKPAFSLYYK